MSKCSLISIEHCKIWHIGNPNEKIESNSHISKTVSSYTNRDGYVIISFRENRGSSGYMKGLRRGLLLKAKGSYLK